jgi:hypothetical protein
MLAAADTGSGDSSFWSLVSSPVSDLRKKMKGELHTVVIAHHQVTSNVTASVSGRASFFDDGPQFNLKIQPHHILAGQISLVLF